MDEKYDQVMGFFDEFLSMCSAEEMGVAENVHVDDTNLKLAEIYNTRETTIKNKIDAILDQCNSYQTSQTSHASNDHQDVGQEVGKIGAEIDALQRRRDTILADVARLQADGTICEQQREALAQRKEALTGQSADSLPRRKHALNLCVYLSGIRWNEDCEPNEIKGYVSNKTCVKPFSLDLNQNSRHFITNYLWDQMQEDW